MLTKKDDSSLEPSFCLEKYKMHLLRLFRSAQMLGAAEILGAGVLIRTSNPEFLMETRTLFAL